MTGTSPPPTGLNLGKRFAPPRFVLWLATFAGSTVMIHLFSMIGWNKSLMAGFDLAAVVFLLALIPLLRTTGAADMRRHALDNDANRLLLLAITTVVSLVIMVSVGTEIEAKRKPDIALIISTLAAAWIFANTVYALHYAHVYYIEDKPGGLDFSGDDDPDYGDFIYFAFTLGMTFQTSDTGIETPVLRRIVTLHSLAAFVFNIGVLAFTINVLGSSSGG